MPQIKQGTIVSAKMQGIVVVKIEQKVKHPFYKKRIKKTKKIKALNEVSAKLGDKVKIIETRPFSKQVHFKVQEVEK